MFAKTINSAMEAGKGLSKIFKGVGSTMDSTYAKVLLMVVVRRHIMGGANRTLISALLPLRLRSRVGNRKLSAGQPHAVAALLEKQESCF